MDNLVTKDVDMVVGTPEEIAMDVVLEVGKEVLNTLKEVAVAKITEEQATERVRLQMRAMTQINFERCRTIVELCKEFSRCYMQNIQVNAEAAKDYRDKAHEVIMYFIQHNIQPDNVYLKIVERYLDDSMKILQCNQINEESYIQVMKSDILALEIK